MFSCPGLVASEFWDTTPEEAREALFEESKKKLLVGHVGTPDEVAEAYIFAMKVSNNFTLRIINLTIM